MAVTYSPKNFVSLHIWTTTCLIVPWLSPTPPPFQIDQCRNLIGAMCLIDKSFSILVIHLAISPPDPPCHFQLYFIVSRRINIMLLFIAKQRVAFDQLQVDWSLNSGAAYLLGPPLFSTSWKVNILHLFSAKPCAPLDHLQVAHFLTSKQIYLSGPLPFHYFAKGK